MGTRLEILARVRQLPDILGKKDYEIAEICGVTPQQWSNYKSDGAHNNEIPPYAALALWNAYGIPMEWIYDGQISRTPDQDMREKLTLANRRAASWLAGRRAQPSRRGGMARIALLAVLGGCFFTGFSSIGFSLNPASALPRAPYYAARTECNKIASMYALESTAEVYGDIFMTCLANHGYSPRSK